MRRTTQTLSLLLFLAAAVQAKPVKAPNGAWTMDIPNSWGPAAAEGYDKLHSSVHAVFHLQEEGGGEGTGAAAFRDYLVVSVQEQTTFVDPTRREEFRAKLQQEVRERGLNAGIENVAVEKVHDRDAWRVEGWIIPPQGRPLKNVKWYVPSGDRTFIFSFNASGDDFQYKLGDFEVMAASIRMKEGPPAAPSKPVNWRLAVTVGGVLVFAICGIAFVVVLRRMLKPPAEEAA
ncbi:MAG: hypothetical protein HUU15_01935 [Candidatus Brocadiae bacterium]|nr:hypothetical protein [Candidatus Brocadiia bacterium]